MALVSVSSKCFKAVETALAAVKSGDICRSMVTLKSIKQDGLLLQREASVLLNRLRQAVGEHQQKEEGLTRQMNELYHDQMQHEKRKTELETKKSSLTNEKERSNQSKQEASRRYRQAEKEKRDAEENVTNWRNIGGCLFMARSLLCGNLLKKMEIRQMLPTEKWNVMKEISRQQTVILHGPTLAFLRKNMLCFDSLAEKNIKDILGKVENLKRRREECHKNLGDVKSMVAFIMQAETFWNEVVALTKAATVKTEHIQRIVAMAAKQNTATILKSKGTQIMTSSFKECWMEVTEMITSEDNNVVLNGEVVLS
ncbi:hypothetical protein OS493_031876 [Desmophyllum pertusum]|uniref:Uncharacterized protein n=1 Tax=Desmophyllum pertusum TaxID=174260 RepID=A0A9W9Y9U9_9CNID|nr:hypothetical protein OS493_031876 [Desmophyllum pertusum]